MISVTEYAKAQGVSRQAILRRIKRGTLKATRVGHYWAIRG